MMVDVTRQELGRWPLGEPFELWPRMREITLEVIMRVVFGSIDTPELKRLREQLGRLTDWMNDPHRLTLLAAAGPRWLARNDDYKQMMEPVEASVLEEVRRRRTRPQARDSDDIASMPGRSPLRGYGSPMTEQDLRDEVQVTLLVDVGSTSTPSLRCSSASSDTPTSTPGCARRRSTAKRRPLWTRLSRRRCASVPGR